MSNDSISISTIASAEASSENECDRNRLPHIICLDCIKLLSLDSLLLRTSSSSSSALDDHESIIIPINNSNKKKKCDKDDDDDCDDDDVDDDWQNNDNSGFIARMRHLWSLLPQLASTYQTLQQTCLDITERFREMHVTLMVEEHRAKVPIITELELTMTMITSIIKEFDHIESAAVYNIPHTHSTAPPLVPPRDISSEHMDSISTDIEADALVSRILQCHSMNEFIKEHCKSRTRSRSRSISAPSPPDPPLPQSDADINLMIAVVDTIGRINQSFFQLTHPYRVTGSINDSIKSALSEHARQSIVIDESCWDQPSMAFIIGSDQCYITSLNPTSDQPAVDTRLGPIPHRLGSESSIIYAKGSVYFFGGGVDQVRYGRYSISQRSWYLGTPIIGIEGGFDISTCYDGDKTIYLVGGKHNPMGSERKYQNRIDAFDLQTQRFTSVGNIHCSLAKPFSFVHQNNVYIVGGYYTDYKETAQIITFDLKKLRSSVFVKDLNVEKDQIHSCCFDGKDTLYILADTFFQLELSTKKRKYLAGPKSEVGFLVYDANAGGPGVAGVIKVEMIGAPLQLFLIKRGIWVDQTRLIGVNGEFTVALCHIQNR
ncbi:hypothetical protein SAMD00019534_003360 [Acytostelium subglobosum LB1]|uniref:hypothetical protein n=1 Tax=Acytostelium subglobosum LB1 TaxID=1410327 RepID=UPI000644A588|nr:hypothetical protein SAMD00019534_003360 [Acytostelium subglobosum LB1]GAM17161.1 hypothetical protein SAMD00019534_003360 [Acytostelium subglobosum LB1]|eukprot:XP_012759223.1 hypothetical protein SAMD00019534_003360 [Acytostelium subglobosum LB1]